MDKLNSFHLYYQEFLKNREDVWYVGLDNGDVLRGVPTTGTLVDFADPSFMFKTDDRHIKIPYRHVLNASKAIIKASDSGAGKILVLVDGQPVGHVLEVNQDTKTMKRRVPNGVIEEPYESLVFQEVGL